MREILFKAKRMDNGEWVEGDLIHSFDGENRFAISNAAGLYEIVPYTICQYTGLTDKNGNKIWENDVVRSTIITERKAKVVYGDFNCSCCYGVYGWTFEPIGEYSEICDIRGVETVEVIGNIFDGEFQNDSEGTKKD